MVRLPGDRLEDRVDWYIVECEDERYVTKDAVCSLDIAQEWADKGKEAVSVRWVKAIEYNRYFIRPTTDEDDE